MILTCPSCGTRYVVKDGAIPEGGRTVRCAQCKHSWHQDPDEGPAGDAVAGPGAVEEPVQHVPEEGHAEEAPQSAMSHPLGQHEGTPLAAELGDHGHPDAGMQDADADEQPLPGPGGMPSAAMLGSEPPAGRWVESEAATPAGEASAAPDPYPEEAVPEEDLPVEEPPVERSSHPLRAARAEADDLYSPFADHDETLDVPRRRWPLILLLVLALVAAIAVAFTYFAPASLKRSVGLAATGGDTPLLVQVKQHSRQQLASGNQLLEVSGLVINPTDEIQSVPPLQAQLRSLEQKVVYRWTIPPPAPRLAPGGSASFNSANLNIPPAAACLDVFFGNPRDPQPPCRDGAAATAGA